MIKIGMNFFVFGRRFLGRNIYKNKISIRNLVKNEET